jgi:hypothetical protein
LKYHFSSTFIYSDNDTVSCSLPVLLIEESIIRKCLNADYRTVNESRTSLTIIAGTWEVYYGR